jgi:hypothetical protein
LIPSATTAYDPDSASDFSARFWETYVHPIVENMFWGETPLVAAMRAATHLEYGVEVPEPH